MQIGYDREMDLRSLRYFVYISEAGSMTRAAGQLGIAQPSLTRHMHRLEEDLGLALFNRVNRGVRLTEAGSRLLEGAARILQDVQRLRQDVGSQARIPSGRVRLGMPPTLCPVLLPQLITRTRQHLPAVALDIIQAGSMLLPDKLAEGQVDVAVMADIAATRLVATTPIAMEEMVLVTRPNARPPRRVNRTELMQTPLILTEAIRTIMNGLLLGRGITLQIEMVLNSLETIRLMAQQGVCATILPCSIARHDHENGLLDMHSLLDGSIQRQLVLARPQGRPFSRASEAVSGLISAVTAELAERKCFAIVVPSGARGPEAVRQPPRPRSRRDPAPPAA